MTRYTVTWRKTAQDQLADIWVTASDRQAVTIAADRIDRELAVDAERKGMPVAEGLRSLDDPPLRVMFTVSEMDRLVDVMSVRAAPPPGVQTNGVPPAAG